MTAAATDRSAPRYFFFGGVTGVGFFTGTGAGFCGGTGFVEATVVGFAVATGFATGGFFATGFVTGSGRSSTSTSSGGAGGGVSTFVADKGTNAPPGGSGPFDALARPSVHAGKEHKDTVR